MKTVSKTAILLLSLFLFLHSTAPKLTSLSSADLQSLIEQRDFTTIIDQICPRSATATCHKEIDDYEALPPHNRPFFAKVKVIGSGAFGQVYSVNNKQAVKVVKANIDDNSFVYLAQEINLGIKIDEANSPNLVPVTDCCVQTHYHGFMGLSKRYTFYITMPYYTVGTLRQFMHDPANLPILATVDWKWSILDGLIQGLRVLHSNGYIHRDLKPENILLEGPYAPRISDFGLAKKMFKYKAGTYAGTPIYMAPEILAHKPYDIEVDVYSMGLVFFEVLNVLNYQKDYPKADDIKHYCDKAIPSRYTIQRLEWDTYCSHFHSVVWRMVSQKPSDRPTFDQVAEYFNSKSDDFFMFEERAKTMVEKFKKLRIADPESEFRKKELAEQSAPKAND